VFVQHCTTPLPYTVSHDIAEKITELALNNNHSLIYCKFIFIH